jgi:hypothetical protein
MSANANNLNKIHYGRFFASVIALVFLTITLCYMNVKHPVLPTWFAFAGENLTYTYFCVTVVALLAMAITHKGWFFSGLVSLALPTMVAEAWTTMELEEILHLAAGEVVPLVLFYLLPCCVLLADFVRHLKPLLQQGYLRLKYW